MPEVRGTHDLVFCGKSLSRAPRLFPQPARLRAVAALREALVIALHIGRPRRVLVLAAERPGNRQRVSLCLGPPQTIEHTLARRSKFGPDIVWRRRKLADNAGIAWVESAAFQC